MAHEDPTVETRKTGRGRKRSKKELQERLVREKNIYIVHKKIIGKGG